MPALAITFLRPSLRVGFNGEPHEAQTAWQLLGNGNRAYNPVLMRFQRADDLSPFGNGGINAYAYCGGDPINRVDPSGHYLLPAMAFGISATVSVGAGLGAALTEDDHATDALAALATVAGVVAAASLLAISAKWLLGRASGWVHKGKYDVARVHLRVQRNPGGSYLKGQPRRTGEGRRPALKKSFIRFQRDVARTALRRPRFQYTKAPPPSADRIRKMAPVERRALLASGYRPLGDKPDHHLYLDALRPIDRESLA